jgi:protein required for attachment to host cells
VCVCASELARLTDRQSGLEATNLRLQRELDLSKTKAEDLKSLKRERDRLSADVTSFREENDGLKAQVAALVRGGTAG